MLFAKRVFTGFDREQVCGPKFGLVLEIRKDKNDDQGETSVVFRNKTRGKSQSNMLL